MSIIQEQMYYAYVDDMDVMLRVTWEQDTKTDLVAFPAVIETFINEGWFPTPWAVVDLIPGGIRNGDERSESIVQIEPPKTAAVGGGNPYHCPAGTGETSGRFTDAMNATCNPQTSQLSVVGLQQRKARMEQLLAGDISAERRARIEEELRLVKKEAERRADGGQPEGLGPTVQVEEGMETVSPRRPGGDGKSNNQSSPENVALSMDPGNLIDFNDPAVEKHLRKQWANNASKVPGLQGMSFEQGVEYFTDNFEKVYERALERSAGKPLSEMSPSELAAAIEKVTIGGQWYPAAHNYARDLSETWGVQPEVAAFTIAALSPTSDWDVNVTNANRTLKALREDYAITEADAIVVNHELGREAVVAGQRLSEMDSEEAGRSIASMFRGNTVKKGKKVEPRPDGVGSRYQDEEAKVSSMIVMEDGSYTFEESFSDITGERTMAPSKSAREYQMVTDVYRASIKQPESLATQRDEFMAVLSTSLGDGHKVRTFYNNIADPFDRSNPSATIDSHSFSSAMGYGFGSGTTITRPDGVKSEIYKDLGQNGTSVKGLQSSYGTVQHALNQAVGNIREKYGVDYKASELQSMTWVEHRLGWPTDSSARSGSDFQKIQTLMYEWEDSGHDPAVGARVAAEIETTRAQAEEESNRRRDEAARKRLEATS